MAKTEDSHYMVDGPEKGKLRYLDITNVMPRYEGVKDLNGRYGEFGGRFIPETLVACHEELEEHIVKFSQDPTFQAEMEKLGRDFIGRPTPMYYAKRTTEYVGGCRIWFKREDLAHTGAHKINNSLAQVLMAKRMGKKRIIAETGAGQHGVATATACALLDMPCVVYMGEEDMRRQSLNVFRMRIMGTEVRGVSAGSATLKDAINQALRDWVTNVDTTHYVIGSAIGPHPFPLLVRDFQSVIGHESRRQLLEQNGKLPTHVLACVGGGSNAIGMFSGFVKDKDVKLIGVEAGGDGVETGRHSSTISAGSPGVLHGTRTYLIQEENGQIIETHSISAGLDYPGVGPEHAHMHSSGRATYVNVTDKEALDAFQLISRLEGIIPALEPAHALAHVVKLAKTLPKDTDICVLISGRGDKDMLTVAKALGVELFPEGHESH